MNRQTPRLFSSVSSRVDWEELHTQTGTPTRCRAFRISRKRSSPLYFDRSKSIRIRSGIAALVVGPLPADKSDDLASVQQANQFKSESLFIQRPIEKEDVGGRFPQSRGFGRREQPQRASNSLSDAGRRQPRLSFHTRSCRRLVDAARHATNCLGRHSGTLHPRFSCRHEGALRRDFDPQYHGSRDEAERGCSQHT